MPVLAGAASLDFAGHVSTFFTTLVFEVFPIHKVVLP